ncbi:MAG: hypothetical protein K2H49_00150, partial [Muribaculaceae bacterium]|nr:hypothetical protein [Muribaculaceae bacterium]
MKTRYIFAVGLLLASGAFSVSAQRDNRTMEKDVTTLLFNDKEDKAAVEKTMKENAPQSPNDNGLPRFTIV